MANPKLKLGKRHETDYGYRYDGVVIADDRKVPVTYRQPPRPDRAISAYVLATGLFAGRGSMRIPAHQAVRAGSLALSIDYTNKGFNHALDSDARDIALVLAALSPKLQKRVIGLSKGGRDTARALVEVGAQVQSATFTASAGFTKKRMSLWEGVRRLAGAGEEVVDIVKKDPLGAARFGASCADNIRHRPVGVLGEMIELLDDDEHASILTVAGSESPPYLRFAYGDEDGLFKSNELIDGATGLPFDDYYRYAGRHMCVAVNPDISREIYRRDSELPPKLPPQPDAIPELLAA
jgi:hypothetical protein